MIYLLPYILSYVIFKLYEFIANDIYLKQHVEKILIEEESKLGWARDNSGYHPLKAHIQIRKVLMFFTGVLTTISVFYLQRYLSFNAVYVIIFLLMVRTFSYFVSSKLKPVFTFQQEFDLSRMLGDDFRYLSTMFKITIVAEIIGLVVGALILSFL